MGMPVAEKNRVAPETKQPPVSATPWQKALARVGFGLLMMAVVGLMTLLITNTLGSATAPPRAAVDGLGIFAVFFVAALAVERLIEPLSLSDPKKIKLEETAQEKKTKVAIATAAETNAAQAITDEQNAKAEAEAWTTYRAVILWGVASIVGALAAALLNLHLLKAAGIQTPSLYLEILATGLIIGAGTKPLHELNKLVTAKKA